EVLNYLAERLDDRAAVLGFIAGTSNCPPNLLPRLISIPETHESLAMNPTASPELLASLSHSTNRWVRIRVAQNPNTPKTVLRQLSADPNDTVRDEVGRTLKLQSERHPQNGASIPARHNHCAQATPVCAMLLFQSHRLGVPGPESYLQTNTWSVNL